MATRRVFIIRVPWGAMGSTIIFQTMPIGPPPRPSALAWTRTIRQSHLGMGLKSLTHANGLQRPARTFESMATGTTKRFLGHRLTLKKGTKNCVIYLNNQDQLFAKIVGEK